jgi:hypothetical protein
MLFSMYCVRYECDFKLQKFSSCARLSQTRPMQYERIKSLYGVDPHDPQAAGTNDGRKVESRLRTIKHLPNGQLKKSTFCAATAAVLHQTECPFYTSRSAA